MNLNILHKNKQTFDGTEHQKTDQPKKQKGRFKEFVAKLSRGLMLPIAMLPIAGLFLGVGAAIVTAAVNSGNTGLEVFGNVIKLPGQVVFDNLAVLFAVAIAITFTKDAGTAGLSAFVGWIVFCALQSALISPIKDSVDNTIIGYSFLYYTFLGTDGITQFNSIFTNNVGIKSLSTSVFGGLTIGFTVAFLYNKFKNIQLPVILGFFSGVRFIPIVTFGTALVVSLIFCMVWPIIGIGLFYLGMYLGLAPVGINSFFFGYIERSLVPFGLHHAFYTPLWYTAAGGTFDLQQNAQVLLADGSYGQIIINGHVATWMDVAILGGFNASYTSVQGDQSIWMFMNSYIVGKDVILANGQHLILTFENVSKGTGAATGGMFTCNPGQYMQGKYSFMMFALPAAAVAMVMAAPKGDSRKVSMSVVISAAFTSFLTGITEPLEFTFLFLAPWMFWGFHAFFCGMSFWMMNLLGAHMGMTFSGGLIDFCIYGIIPDTMGAQANCYWAVIIGLVLIPIYYFGFYWAIKKFNIPTPGRGTATKLITKQEYLAKVAKTGEANTDANENKLSDIRFKSIEIIKAYGGLKNIKNVDACITKLRIQVIDQTKVNKEQLMNLGAKGVIKPSPQSVYAVFGTEADRIKNEINEITNLIQTDPKKYQPLFGL